MPNNLFEAFIEMPKGLENDILRYYQGILPQANAIPEPSKSEFYDDGSDENLEGE